MMRAPTVGLMAWVVGLFGFGGLGSAHAQLPSSSNFPTTVITSPYGPRYVTYPKTSTRQFNLHFGVDYAAPSGTPILAVEGGEVRTIDIDTHDNYYIGIEGATDYFSYLHIFNNDPNSPQFDTLPRKAYYPTVNGIKGNLVTYESFRTPSGGLCDAIVFWGDSIGTPPATRALSPCPGYALDGTTTTNQVSPTDVIALVGDSGVALGHPHVHLQEARGAVNPLATVAHDPSNFDVRLVKPKPNAVLDYSASPVSLRVSVDPGIITNPDGSPLTTRGFDLDAVEITIFPEGTDRNHAVLNTVFNYGGLGGGSRQNMTESINATSLGVSPQGNGKVDFVVPFDFNGLDPGKYTILVEAKNIFGSDSPAPPPTYSVTIGNFAATEVYKGTLNSSSVYNNLADTFNSSVSANGYTQTSSYTQSDYPWTDTISDAPVELDINIGSLLTGGMFAGQLTIGRYTLTSTSIPSWNGRGGTVTTHGTVSGTETFSKDVEGSVALRAFPGDITYSLSPLTVTFNDTCDISPQEFSNTVAANGLCSTSANTSSVLTDSGFTGFIAPSGDAAHLTSLRTISSTTSQLGFPSYTESYTDFYPPSADTIIDLPDPSPRLIDGTTDGHALSLSYPQWLPDGIPGYTCPMLQSPAYVCSESQTATVSDSGHLTITLTHQDSYLNSLGEPDATVTTSLKFDLQKQ